MKLKTPVNLETPKYIVVYYINDNYNTKMIGHIVDADSKKQALDLTDYKEKGQPVRIFEVGKELKLKITLR